jgi:hypothetical protein
VLYGHASAGGIEHEDDGVLRCKEHGGVVPAATAARIEVKLKLKSYHKHKYKNECKRKKTDPAIFQKNAAAICDKKKIAEDVLMSHRYKVRGGGPTASGGGASTKYRYVATFKKKASPTVPTCCSARVQHLQRYATKHVLKFAELASIRGSWSNMQQPWWMRRGRRSCWQKPQNPLYQSRKSRKSRKSRYLQQYATKHVLKFAELASIRGSWSNMQQPWWMRRG